MQSRDCQATRFRSRVGRQSVTAASELEEREARRAGGVGGVRPS